MALHNLCVVLALIVGYDAKALTNMSIIIEDPIPEITRENYRLKTDVFPKHYSVELTLPTNFYQVKTFLGSVEIAIVLNSAELDKEITLNAKDLNFTCAKLYHPNAPNENLLNLNDSYYTVPKLDRVVLKLSDEKVLDKDCSYVISLKYEGTLHDEMHGFYLSSYKNKNNQNE